MHTFVGHRDVVLEFQWRPSRPDDSYLQLVTWSKDQTLLVWKIEPFLQKLCGYEPDNLSIYDDNSSGKCSHQKNATQIIYEQFKIMKCRPINIPR